MKFLDYWIYLALSMIKLSFFALYTGTDLFLALFVMHLAGMLVLSSWTLLLTEKKRRVFLLLLLFLHSTLIISDIWYYQYFESFLSIVLITEVPQMTSVGGGFMTLVQGADFLFFADFFVFLLLLFLLPVKEKTFRVKKLAAGSTLVLGLVLFITPIAAEYVENNRLPGQVVSNMKDYYQLGFWGFHGFDLVRGAGNLLGWEGEVPEQEAAVLAGMSKETGSASIEETPNVIIVQLESYQASVINKKINDQELTPNLNQLQSEMLYFPNFYHQTHEGRTSDAEFIFNTSLHPLKAGSVYPQYPQGSFNALPQLLQTAGYETAAMHAYDKDFWNRAEVYQTLGFDHFYSEEDYSAGEVIGLALNDKDFFQESFDFMKELESPFYAFTVALTSHTPYEFPEEKQKLDLSGVEDPLTAGYFHTVHFVDDAIGELVENLKEEELWEESIVIFYGDHDSGLNGAEGEMERKEEASHAVELFDLDKRVPLFIKQPGVSEGEIIAASGGQIDVAPTILDLLGMEKPVMLGSSLLEKKDQLVVFRDGSFRYGDVYYRPDLAEETGIGTCYSVSEAAETELSACSPWIEEAEQQLELSDTIIERRALQ